MNGNISTHKFRDLKRLRLRTELSQAKLARKANVGEDTYRKAERGEPVTESVALKIFRAVNELLGGKLVAGNIYQVLK